MPGERIEAQLYKLLLYEKGGFFLPHRDGEKQDGMVASLIVVLAGAFDEGELTVRHANEQQVFRFKEAARGEASCFAAFYTDCEHEVSRVTQGARLCLAYNLILKPKRDRVAQGKKKGTGDDGLTTAIEAWTAIQPGKPLVIALEHHYTRRGLKLELLKGADRKLAGRVASAAEDANCLVFLAEASRHLNQYADDGSGYRGRGYFSGRSRELDIGETYEDDFRAHEWTDLAGKKQPWGSMKIDKGSVVSDLPLEEWIPTREKYEGYTGNAGNTLERWYHASVMVLWRRDHHFDVMASRGPAVSIPLFRTMVDSLAKTPKKRLAEAQDNIRRFASAIIAAWPGPRRGIWFVESADRSQLEEFPALALGLHDRDVISRFLSTVADRDPTAAFAKLVVTACREFGWAAFAQELKRILAPPASKPGEPFPIGWREIPLRDWEWLAAFCLDPSADLDRSTLANELCQVAVARFCAPSSNDGGYARSPGPVRAFD